MSNLRSSQEEEEAVISLNVGGKIFVTTTTTLLKDTKSMLYAMFSGRYPTKKDSNGGHFIDRDGKTFRYVLNFLRDGSIDLPDKPHTLNQILREARFYQVEGLVRVVLSKIQKLKVEKGNHFQKGDYAVVYLGGYGNNAVVYTKDTEGGFTSSCVALNRLAEKGYHVEGVASGPNGNYYAILRSDIINDGQNHNIYQKTETKSYDYSDEASSDTL